MNDLLRQHWHLPIVVILGSVLLAPIVAYGLWCSRTFAAPSASRVAKVSTFGFVLLSWPLALLMLAWMYDAVWGFHRIWGLFPSERSLLHAVVLGFAFIGSPLASIYALVRGKGSAKAGRWCIVASLVVVTYVLFAMPAFKDDYWLWLSGDTVHSGDEPMPAIYFQQAGMFASVLSLVTLAFGVIHGGLLLYFDERAMSIPSAGDGHRGTRSLD
jgi:hypothetical protein